MSQTIDRTTAASRVDMDAPTVAIRRPVATGADARPVAPAHRPVPVARAPHPSHPFAAMPQGPSRSEGSHRGWRRAGVVAAAGVGAAALLGSLAVANQTTDVAGSVTVKGMSGYVAVGQSCVPTPSSTLRTVSLFDGSGDLVGVTGLPSSGIAVNTGTSYTGTYGYADACRYDITLADVDLSDDFYRVSLGSDASSGVSFTREQVESGVHTTWGL